MICAMFVATCLLEAFHPQLVSPEPPPQRHHLVHAMATSTDDAVMVDLGSSTPSARRSKKWMERVVITPGNLSLETFSCAGTGY